MQKQSISTSFEERELRPHCFSRSRTGGQIWKLLGCPLISSKKVVSTLIVYTLMVCCPAAGALTLTTLGPARTSCPGVAGDPAAAMVVMPGEAILMMVGDMVR